MTDCATGGTAKGGSANAWRPEGVGECPRTRNDARDRRGLRQAPREVNRSPGYAQAWGFLFDIIHHRGQITTYLRAMGSTVPQIYGPTADEP